MGRLSRILQPVLRPSTSPTGLWSWITTVDHKRIGIMYGITAFIFFLVGGAEAFLIRLQLAGPNLRVLGPDTYNAMFTMHATTMIFLAVMPLSAAFMNYFLPLMIGARDVAFPRLNAFSYWTFLFGGIFLNSSWFLGGAPNGGWFGYAPLSGTTYSSGPGMDFWLIGLQLLGVGTLISGFNFIVTILNMRAPGMTLTRMPVFVWTTLVTSFLVIFSFPSITVGLFMLMFDRLFGANFFVVSAGADPVLWQHLFWVFGHPEVYILILPAMGIVSEILPTFSRKPLFGYSAVVFSSALIGFLAFAVWGHHMFTVGQGPIVNTIFALATMTIAIPTGIKIFNWLMTMWGGRVRFTTAMLYAVGFIAVFTIGGLSGVMHASAPSDYQQHDTYFVVAHIHYVLVGGALLSLFGGLYYWLPKMTGRMLSEKLGKVNFWLVLIGLNMVFFPFHFLGLMGMPRRIWTYPADQGWNFWNLFSTVGVFVLTLGILVFIINYVLNITLKRGEIASNDPWDGRTLEWSIPSPVPAYNFLTIPKVRARDAFWAEKYPESVHLSPAKEEAQPQGGHGGRIHMPSNSAMPFIMGIGLLILSYGGRYHNNAVALLGAAVTVLSLYGWAYEDDSGYMLEPKGDH